MAKAGNAVGATGWTAWSPDHLVDQTTIHRRYVRIPSDQKALLARQDAWSTGGVPNVPARVLDELTVHRAKAASPRPQPASQGTSEGGGELSSQPPSPRSAAAVSDPGNGEVPRPPPEAPRTPSQEDADQDCEVGDTSGTPIMSWSPSPSAHYRRPHPQEEPVPTADTGPRRPIQHPAPQPPGPTVSPATFPVGVTLSSSLASDAGLEVEPPRAITDVLAPVNRGAVTVLQPTPPSAQVIPCTLPECSNPVQAPEPKRRRLMKAPAAVFGSPGSVDHKHAPKPLVGRSTASAVSPLPSPTDHSSPRRKASPRAPMATPSIMSPAEDGRASGCRADQAAPPAPAATAARLSAEGSSNTADKPPPNELSSRVPFTTFKLAYPDYEGSLGDYIRGVIYILKLQKDKALPEFLYDDFMRFFARDYLDYIDAVGLKGLPAIQRYNETVSRPVYTKGLLTKDNIRSIATQYPEKLRLIQQELKASGTGTPSRAATHWANTSEGIEKTTHYAAEISISEAASESFHKRSPNAATTRSSGSAANEAESSSATPYPAVNAPSVQGNCGGVTVPEGGIDALEPPSARRAGYGPSTIDSMGATATPGLSAPGNRISSSSPDTEPAGSRQAANTKLPRETLAASVAPSQLSNPDSIPEVSLSRRAPLRDTARSSAGEPGAAFKRPKTRKRDPEKRDLLWRKFLLQRTAQSSAPERSAPS